MQVADAVTVADTVADGVVVLVTVTETVCVTVAVVVTDADGDGVGVTEGVADGLPIAYTLKSEEPTYSVPSEPIAGDEDSEPDNG